VPVALRTEASSPVGHPLQSLDDEKQIKRWLLLKEVATAGLCMDFLSRWRLGSAVARHLKLFVGAADLIPFSLHALSKCFRSLRRSSQLRKP
jgi:hypothetical protein